VKDLATFQKYYEEFMPKIFRYVYSKVSDRELAEDLVSEISLKALEHFESYDASYPFGGWFYGIARNHLIDYYKKYQRLKITSLDEIENLLPNSDNPARDAERAMSGQRVRAALAKLNDEKKELVTLHYFSGYSYKEIADMFGRQENAVKVATHRAVAELKKMLQHYTD
jgi:RNA polymerase sigma-70 factor (ECF subfamily)